MTAMVNTVRTGAEEVAASLEAQGVEVHAHPGWRTAWSSPAAAVWEELEAFQRGLFYIQDPASRLAVLASGAAAGMRVLDVCAAPGGKSLPLPSKWETGARWCPAISIPTKDPDPPRGGAVGPVLRPGPSPRMARSAGRSGRRPLTWCWWTRPAPGWGDPEKAGHPL